jgi:hypothetical protein
MALTNTQVVIPKRHQAKDDAVTPQDLNFLQTNIEDAFRKLQDQIYRKYGTPTLTVEDSKNLVLLNGWISNGTGTPLYRASPKYYKDPFSRVWLSGNIKNGTVGSVIAMLPEGYMPLEGERFDVEANGAYGWLYISGKSSTSSTNPPGAILYGGGSTATVSLSGISFRVA